MLLQNPLSNPGVLSEKNECETVTHSNLIFVVGGGPSISTININRLRGYRCIAVNNSYTIVPWAETLWFGDLRWWWWHREELAKINMSIATCCENQRIKSDIVDQSRLTFYSRDFRRYGICTIKDRVCWNSNSGASAINLAYWMGAKTIILLGFDMHFVKGQKNYHKDHPIKDGNPFKRHIKCFPFIKSDAQALGLTIINATPGSAIIEFPICTLEEFLNEL